MTEQHGLGLLPSPPDDRDFPIERLYSLRGIEPVATPPAEYIVPGDPGPVLNQGNTPQCVAYSSAGMKEYQDRLDQGEWFNFNESLFFSRIGGGPNGAYVRDAMKQLLAAGYPVVGVDDAAEHKIAAYYAVPVTELDIQQALMAFGPVIIGTTWYNSWFDPTKGVLPKPDYEVGGHAIRAIGWDSRGLRLRNSWGSSWGISGDCWLPWKYLASAVGECWKAVDQIIAPPPPPVPYVPRIAVEYTAIEPTRLIDSRTTGGKLTAKVSRVVQVTGDIVPEGATAITGNLTITQPSGGGFASLTPSASTPTTSSINFGAGQTVANGFTIGLWPDGSIAVYSIVAAHFILDITGYFTA